MDVPLNIIKGKRTKRPRPSSSPINFPLTTSTSSSGENYSNPSAETDEEEDMANCLILLARSGTDTKNLTDKAVGVDGFYGGGYECKTCNKTFHSFQALGGHRASHKRPKTDTAERSLITAHQFKFHDDREEVRLSMNVITVSEHRLIKKSGSSKVHECSICGTEFSSGQALGGHMRRHRSVTTTARITSLDIEKTNDGKRETDEAGRRFLLLDLNLPAPDEDQVFTTSNQSSMVFATPSLVDCHY